MCGLGKAVLPLMPVRKGIIIKLLDVNDILDLTGLYITLHLYLPLYILTFTLKSAFGATGSTSSVCLSPLHKSYQSC